MNRRPIRARRALAAGVVVPLLAAGLVSCGDDDEPTAGDKASTADTSASSEPADETSVEPAGR